MKLDCSAELAAKINEKLAVDGTQLPHRCISAPFTEKLCGEEGDCCSPAQFLPFESVRFDEFVDARKQEMLCKLEQLREVHASKPRLGYPTQLGGDLSDPKVIGNSYFSSTGKLQHDINQLGYLIAHGKWDFIVLHLCFGIL